LINVLKKNFILSVQSSCSFNWHYISAIAKYIDFRKWAHWHVDKTTTFSWVTNAKNAICFDESWRKAEESLRTKDQEIGRLKRKVLCTLFLIQECSIIL